MTEAKTFGDLQPGDTFEYELIRTVTLTVVSVENTGAVKMGQVGPNATPIVRVNVEGMPKPFGSWIETAADHRVSA